MSQNNYSRYFEIDPMFIACVTSADIQTGNVSWKNFYPHDTFINLLEKIVKLLNHETHESIWIQGAYGSGKSYAALTIKALLEAKNDDVREYFKKYSNSLKPELLDDLITGKNAGRWLVIFRSGSSDINNDEDLYHAIYSSIEEVIQKECDISMTSSSLSANAAMYLENDPAIMDLFSRKMSELNTEKYGPANAGELVEHLKSGDPQLVSSAMKIFTKVSKNLQIYAIKFDCKGITDWIGEIINHNKLGGILFIWDEFSDYFKNNARSLSNFQNLAMIGNTVPFHFVIVAHERENFIASHGIAKNIIDRFTDIKIELPDNMAFKLIADAMKLTSDEFLRKEWQNRKESLASDLQPVINRICENLNAGRRSMKIKSSELTAVLPIHPYSAMVLKHISVLFGSNQRSMFEFIIHKYDGVMDFNCFINEHSPLDDNNLLTADMLWDFFYEHCQTSINERVRRILDAYRFNQDRLRNEEEKNILKVLLLLDAISTIESDIQILRPSKENLELAFAGLESWNEGKTSRLIENMVKNNVLFEKPLANGQKEYTIADIVGDDQAIVSCRVSLEEKLNTKDLILEDAANMGELFKNNVPAWFPSRFDFTFIAGRNLDKDYDTWLSCPKTKFKVLIGIAKDLSEGSNINAFMKEKGNKLGEDLILIDAGSSILGEEKIKNYLDQKARSLYYLERDNTRAEEFARSAQQHLKEWRDLVSEGQFVVYSKLFPEGRTVTGKFKVYDLLEEIDLKKYPYGPESWKLTNDMYKDTKLKLGAEYGITQTIRNLFNFPKGRKSLPEHLEAQWGKLNYWQDNNLEVQAHPITKLKIKIDQFIQKEFSNNSGKVSVRKLCEKFEEQPYGLLPNNISSFLMGFILKEYTDGSYFGSTAGASRSLDSENLSKMLEEVLKAKKQGIIRGNAASRIDEIFIVQMSPEHLEFLGGTITIFKLSHQDCDNIDAALLQIRTAMRQFSFPIWSLEYLSEVQNKINERDLIIKLLNLYCNIANTSNSSGLSENQYASEIGRNFKANPDIVTVLSVLVNSKNTEEGMRKFIESYKDGELSVLAHELQIGNRYLEDVKRRFNADNSNWVWNKKTAYERIDAVILDYKLVNESNSILSFSRTYDECIQKWNNKISQIKIPFSLMKEDNVGGLYSLLKMLCELYQRGEIHEKDREKFLLLIQEHKHEFICFCNESEHQIKLFMIYFKSFIGEMNNEELKAFIETIPEKQFGRQSSEYNNLIDQLIKEFKKKQAKTRLTEKWYEYTGTKNPRQWSQQYRTPILCMMDGDLRDDAKKLMAAFEGDPKDTEVKKVLEFIEQLQSSNFFVKLKDPKEADRKLLEYFAKDYGMMINDPDEIRQELENHIDNIDDWMKNDGLKAIELLADRKYKLHGLPVAQEYIRKLSENDLREYLIKLIDNSSKFGMEILRQPPKYGSK